MAEVQIDGKRLKIKDIAIYSDVGDVPNQVGALKLKKWLRDIAIQVSEQGFDELQVTGKRVLNSTSANPGHTFELLNKLNGGS